MFTRGPSHASCLVASYTGITLFISVCMLMCASCRHKRDKDVKSKLDLLGQIEAAEQTLQQTSRDKVDSAVAEFDTVVCH